MPTGTLIIQILICCLATWLGAYLLVRNNSKPQLAFAGLGLLSYALALASDILAAYTLGESTSLLLRKVHSLTVFLPATFWAGTLAYLLPEDWSKRTTCIRFWGYILLPVTLVYTLALIFTEVPILHSRGLGDPLALPLYVLVITPLLAGLVLNLRGLSQREGRASIGLVAAATIFFGLGVSLLLYPLGWLPAQWVLLAIGGDLALLGLAIALLDAFEEGETLLPDMGRSLNAAALAMLVFGGQVVLVMFLATGITAPMLGLLLAVLVSAIVWQTLSDPIQGWLDQLVFARTPGLRRSRSELRQISSQLPRVDQDLDPRTLNPDRFARLTRRALSHMGDLPRLASSPLTRLPLIEARLNKRDQTVDTLARAAELKLVLSESIMRLKPASKGNFGTTDEWRYYNALYFPYVAGLKPYSRRYPQDHLDPEMEQAREWFTVYVPERTLYNWQNAAAKLVAQDIWEQNQQIGSRWQ